MELGECYQIITPPNGRHWFVVSIQITEERFLLFPFTSKKSNSDSSCVLYPGEDAPGFVQHETVISYHKAIEITEVGLTSGLQRGYYNKAGIVSQDLLNKILKAGLTSKFTRNKWKPLIEKMLTEHF